MADDDLIAAVCRTLDTHPAATLRELMELVPGSQQEICAALGDLVLQGRVVTGTRNSMVTYRLDRAPLLETSAPTFVVNERGLIDGLRVASDALKAAGLRERLRSIGIDLEEAGIDACEHGLPHSVIKAVLTAHSEVRRALEKVG